MAGVACGGLDVKCVLMVEAGGSAAGDGTLIGRPLRRRECTFSKILRRCPNGTIPLERIIK